MKILIAEDESTSRLLLQTHLVKWGHEVVVTEDGLQALAVLREEGAPMGGHEHRGAFPA